MAEGFTKFQNSILEALYCTKLSAKQIKVFLYIVRWTIGYKDMHRRLLSVSQMASEMNDDRRHVSDAVRDLEQMGMIRVVRYGSGARSEFEILPPEYWDKPVPISAHVGMSKTAQVTCAENGTPPVPITAQEPVPISAHFKETNKTCKEKRKKEASPQDTFEPVDEDEDDDDGLDPAVVLEMLRRERDGDLSVQ